MLPVLGLGTLYLVLTSTAFFTAESTHGEEDWPLRADQVGYYIYLPALLTDQGLTFEGVSSGPRWERFRARGFAGFYGVDAATGRPINGFTPGVAVLLTPFFALGHIVAHLTGSETDGFSAPYRFLAAVAGALYATLGLLFVFLAVRSRFSDGVAAAVLLLLGLGTNLLYYATFEPVMTHAYSFFAFALLTWATLAWERAPMLRLAVAAGVALGVAVAIRPTNGVVALVPAGYLTLRRVLDGGPTETALMMRHFAAAAAVALVCSLPLFTYWRFATGHWITNPFGPGTFYLDQPRIGGVLWSYRKGWFVYTPLMLASIPGLYFLPRYLPRMALPLVGCATAIIYIAASYWNWWFGGSFGLRAFIELSAPLSLALAAFVAWSHEDSRRRQSVSAVLGLLVLLNVFQTYQYLRGYIHWDGMTRSSYWAVFLRPSISDDQLGQIRAEWDLELPRLPRSQ